MEIWHIPGLVCTALDLALTPKIIKSGFAATGIAPFNPDIFSDADFVQAVEQNANAVAVDNDLTEDEQRRIVVTDAMNVHHEEEVLTSDHSEPSTSRSAMSTATSYSSILDEIGPLQAVTPKKPSKRGRKAMESTELTSPDNRALLKNKAAAAAAKKTPKKATPPAKRSKTKKTSPSSDEDDADFCIICLKLLPAQLTSSNSIKCNVCKRPVHLKCAGMRRSYFTCIHCDSDLDDDEDDVEDDE